MKMFKQVLLESHNINDEISQLRTHWKEMGVDVFIYLKYNDLSLSHIKVDKDKRGQGLGTLVMKELLSFAQTHNFRVILTPSKDLGATSLNRLIKFYRRLGFVSNKGHNKDFRISETMIWSPKAINNSNNMKPIIKESIADDIRENPFYKTYNEVIEESFGKNLRKYGAMAGLVGATSGLGAYHTLKPTQHYDTHKPLEKIQPVKPEPIDRRQVDRKIMATYDDLKRIGNNTRPTNKKVPLINTLVSHIIKHEGLHPYQTPMRITNPFMRRWNNILGFEIDRNPIRPKERANFIYLKNADDVPKLIKKQLYNYATKPHQYSLPHNVTLRQALHKFDQTGAKSKIRYLTDNIPNLNVDAPLRNIIGI